MMRHIGGGIFAEPITVSGRIMGLAIAPLPQPAVLSHPEAERLIAELRKMLDAPAEDQP